jgi:hypothetical protein
MMDQIATFVIGAGVLVAVGGIWYFLSKRLLQGRRVVIDESKPPQ